MPDETPPPPGDVTQALANRARENDRGAFGSLYERLAPAIYAWAALRIRPATRRNLAPEDVVQETWWRAFASFGTFDPATTSFRAWVFGIASHVLLDAFRRGTVRSRVHTTPAVPRGPTVSQTPDDATPISTRVAKDEALRAMIEKFRELDDDDRNLLVLCGLEGATAAQAAVDLGIGAEAVAKRWQRLRARLRDAGITNDLVDDG